jgi:DHA2 family multidrug resistance protein
LITPAGANPLFSRNIGITLAILLLLIYGPLPMLVSASIYFLRHVDSRLAIVIGFAAFVTASLLGAQLTHDLALEDCIVIVMLQSIGQAFLVLPIIVTSLANSYPARATVYAAFIQIMRLGGAQIGIALIGAWLRVREQLNSAYIGLHVQSGDPNVMRVLQALVNCFTSYGAGTAQARAVSTLSATVEREANVLAYIDAFWLCFYFAIAGLVLIALLTRAPRGPLSPTPLSFLRRYDGYGRRSVTSSIPWSACLSSDLRRPTLRTCPV